MKEDVKISPLRLESGTTKRKKRQRSSTVSETEEKDSRLEYEKNYAEGFMKKLSERLEELTYIEVLNVLQNFETNALNVDEFQNKIDSLLKNHEDLRLEFLGFLQPSHTLQNGKLMDYLKISDMKEFILKLMLHFKKQPHLLKKIIDKLHYLSEEEHLQLSMIEENIAPFLPKNSDLMQTFLRLFPSERPLEKYFVGDDVWEEFNVDDEVIDEETFDASHVNEVTNFESKSCFFGCKRDDSNSTACIICDVKYINGRMYIANGRVLRPANLIFDPANEKEHTNRLCGKNDYYASSTSRPSKVHKRSDTCVKEVNEGGLSPFLLGTESEEEVGENDVHASNKKRKNSRGLKIRFKSKKKKSNKNIFLSDQPQTDDTAPSNDDGSCDDTSKEDNDYNSCEESAIERADLNLGLPAKEIVSLENMEFNISTCAIPTNKNAGEASRSTHEVPKPVKSFRTNLI